MTAPDIPACRPSSRLRDSSTARHSRRVALRARHARARANQFPAHPHSDSTPFRGQPPPAGGGWNHAPGRARRATTVVNGRDLSPTGNGGANVGGCSDQRGPGAQVSQAHGSSSRSWRWRARVHVNRPRAACNRRSAVRTSPTARRAAATQLPYETGARAAALRTACATPPRPPDGP